MNVKYNESRQLTILRILNEKKDWITGKALSEKLGVSDRTIRNDISIINYDIEPYSANIISERGKGYKLSLIHIQMCIRDRNYTAYEGDDSFLEGTTEKTDKVWAKAHDLIVE